jgi:glycosyl transferase family 4
VSEPLRVAVLEHDSGGAAERLAAALAAAGTQATLISPAGLPDAPLRLRKIGEAPGRMPAALLELTGGHYDVAHAFTAQDAVVAIAWSRLAGRPAVYTQRDPLTRANLANRRWRLGTLRLALERSAAVVAPDAAAAASLRRWMAVDAEVLATADSAAHLALYAALRRR